MGLYNEVALQLKAQPKTWLITGVAGFIGSNVLEALLKLDQTVVGVDNFSTGYQGNLDDVEAIVTPAQWSRFRFFEGDIRDLETCRAVCKDIDYVLHQAALGSVPRSINDPVTTNSVNIDGFLNMMVAARDASVERFVYAASSSTYGDHPALPKTESIIGRPLSPYAVTKYVNELYADVFFNSYGFRSVGLRYFNVFGRRQDPSGAYAAVIPRWINAMINADEIFINGDGETSRDFCFIDNAVQANILAAVRAKKGASVYNIACGERTSLNELFDLIKMELEKRGVLYANEKNYREFRKGDVKHSLANISLAEADLGYKPLCTAKEGLAATVDWFVARRSK